MAILAARSLDMPLSLRASYWSSFFTLADLLGIDNLPSGSSRSPYPSPPRACPHLAPGTARTRDDGDLDDLRRPHHPPRRTGAAAAPVDPGTVPLGGAPRGRAPEPSALELCTGAGHIGLLLAALSDARVVAVDVDPVAGEFARANAEEAGLSDRFEVRVGPMDRVLGADERFGVVVADPPWVPRAETGRFPEDPLLAIDGGDDGLEVARLCLNVSARHLLPGGHLVLQLGSEAQAEELCTDLPGRPEPSEVRTCEGGVLVHLGPTDLSGSGGRGRRSALWVESHHGGREVFPQAQTATTGRVTGCSTPWASRTVSAPRTSSGPSGTSSTRPRRS